MERMFVVQIMIKKSGIRIKSSHADESPARCAAKTSSGKSMNACCVCGSDVGRLRAPTAPHGWKYAGYSVKGNAPSRGD